MRVGYRIIPLERCLLISIVLILLSFLMSSCRANIKFGLFDFDDMKVSLQGDLLYRKIDTILFKDLF